MNREIRTPLNGIIGFTDLLKQSQLDDQQKIYLNNIVESGTALHGIINDVLDFSQLEADKIHLEVIQVDILDMLRSTIDMVSFYANQKKLELVLNVDENIPDLFQTDPARLKQVLIYLLNNAIKFTEVGKVSLTVKFSPVNDHQGRFTFSVKDTGIGISKEMKPKLFDAFSKSEQATNVSNAGVGLGLTISNKLVGKMGGEIEFKSDEGVGSEFYFVLESSYKFRLKNEVKGNLAIKKVLLIDSDLSNQLILKENFQRWGVELVISKDAKDAIIQLQSSLAFDTVIVENQINNGEGIDTIRTIRDKLNLNSKRLPVILLNSTIVNDGLREECERLEVKYILNKPVSASEFYQYLKNIKEETFTQKFVSSNEKKNKLRSIPYECTIMIAEDVKMSMLLIKTLLNKMMPNATVITAANGIEAVQMMQTNEVDLVFMDVQMPEMNGLEATKIIRQNEENSNVHIPIIALTAGATIEEKNQCFDYGMDEYLSKPIHIDELFDLLYKYFVTE
jgi:CheY-like chemotaxis protein